MLLITVIKSKMRSLKEVLPSRQITKHYMQHAQLVPLKTQQQSLQEAICMVIVCLRGRINRISMHIQTSYCLIVLIMDNKQYFQKMSENTEWQKTCYS